MWNYVKAGKVTDFLLLLISNQLIN